jgi:hypothetical protein
MSAGICKGTTVESGYQILIDNRIFTHIMEVICGLMCDFVFREYAAYNVEGV